MVAQQYTRTLLCCLDYYYYCYYRGAWRSTFYNFKYFAPHFSNARYYLFCLCHTERVFYWLDQFNIHELSAKKRESDPENVQKIGARFFKLNQFLILGSRLEFQLPTEKWIRPIKLQWFNVILIWWHSTTPSLQHTFFSFAHDSGSSMYFLRILLCIVRLFALVRWWRFFSSFMVLMQHIVHFTLRTNIYMWGHSLAITVSAAAQHELFTEFTNNVERQRWANELLAVKHTHGQT